MTAVPKELSAYLAKIGRKGGRQTSLAKSLAVRANAIEYGRRLRAARAGKDPCDGCTRFYPCPVESRCRPRKIFLAGQKDKKGVTP